MSAAPARPLALFGRRRGLAYALLWAAACTAVESAVPIGFYDLRQTLAMVCTALFLWALSGVILLAFTSYALPRLSTPSLLFAAGMLLPLLAFGYRELSAALFREGGWWSALQGPLTASDGYLVWIYLLYGGMFVGGSAVAYRAERTRTMLARAEIARSRSQTLFSQAQIAGVQGSVDPHFVLRVLDAMQNRYGNDAADADRLLDGLVEFLRLAMPGVRSGQSTLGAELAIVRSHARLLVLLDPSRSAWRCEINGVFADLPFPPLLLLPVLDELADARSANALTLTASPAPGHVVIVVHGPAMTNESGSPLLHRLRIGLHAVYGPAAQVTAAPPGSAALPALTISLPLPAAPVRRNGDSPALDSHGGSLCKPLATMTT